MVKTTKPPLPDPEVFGRVAVLMGGLSAERDISLQSGDAVLKALVSQGVDAFGLDVGFDVVDRLQNEKPHRVFIALHGGEGENGEIQALCDCLSIPYTGSGVLACALTLDKMRTKWLWQGLGMQTPRALLVEEHHSWDALKEVLGNVVVIKPVHEGSTLGLSIVRESSQLEPALEKASQYNCPVMAESYIEGPEYTVGILNDAPLPVIEIQPAKGLYDYEAKYLLDSTKFFVPDLPKSRLKAIQVQALEAFRAVGCYGWGRVDILSDKEGNSWLLEVNTVPGMTSHSLVPTAAKHMGIQMEELVMRILAQTL